MFTEEACLDDLVSEYLGGVTLHRLLGDYNLALPVASLSTSAFQPATVHLIGVQAMIPAGQGWPVVKQGCPDCHPTATHPQLGFYAGGICETSRDIRICRVFTTNNTLILRLQLAS